MPAMKALFTTTATILALLTFGHAQDPLSTSSSSPSSSSDSSAQPIIQVPLYGYDTQPALAASVIAVVSKTTTMRLFCATSTDDCGLFPYQTLIYGPSIYSMDAAAEDFTATVSCDIASATVTAVCVESDGGSSANFPGLDTSTYTDGTVYPVTVTGGASLLQAAAAAGVTSTTQPETIAVQTTGSATRVVGASSTGAAVTLLQGSTESSSQQHSTSTSPEGRSSTTASASAGTASPTSGAQGLSVGGAAMAVGILGLLCL